MRQIYYLATFPRLGKRPPRGIGAGQYRGLALDPGRQLIRPVPEDPLTRAVQNLAARANTNVSRADLAVMCGLSRQTLNKVLKSFQDAGVIATAYRRLEILDVEALQAIAFRPPL